ncbi:synaptotagmin-15-like [Haliotis cracherodii]|uniref:synaptotagmin-15-like n=1 Tax=Haliotis cracherodii TaxID=6455 RepID=UPI0039E9B27B
MANTGHSLPPEGGGQSSPQKVDDGGIFVDIDTTSLAIILGCSAGAFLLIVFAVILFRLRRRRRKLYESSFDDGDDPSSSRSMPTSRSSSPNFSKRLSCPEVGASGKPVIPMIRSVTIDGIPFQLPTERVQPGGNGRRERGGSLASLPRQHSILGSVQPELYRPQSGSEDDEAYLPATPHGRLWFSVIYDAAVEQLQVTLIKVKGLPGRIKHEAPRDPFVKVFLLPDEKTCKVSKVRKKTLSPIFNETFQFQASPDDVYKRTLRFSVYDVDKRRVRHSLGHVMVPLKDIDLTKSEPLWSDLEPMAHATSCLGELYFSLTYHPQTERIKVVIIRVRQLRHLDYGGETGMYVRIQYCHGRKTHKTKRTVLLMGASEAEINESFSFSISGRQLDSCSFVMTLMTSPMGTRSSHHEEYGRVTVGPFLFARGQELLHWQEMISQPRSPITRWHTLTPTSALEPDR